MSLRDRIFELTHWIRHRWKSRIRHGVHSPFVFALQDGPLKEAALEPIPVIEDCRSALLRDKQSFIRTDFGAGSRKRNGLNTTIAQFAASSLQDAHSARVLRGLAKAIDAKYVLELGTAYGITTAYLAYQRPESIVFTIEGDPAVAAVAQKQWRRLEINNIHSSIGAFADVLHNDEFSANCFDLILMDGHHTYEATMHYWQALKGRLSKYGAVVLDDIYWSPGMLRAWRQIQADPDVTLSLDYFHWGVVFIFPRPQHEHFLLRLPTTKARTKFY